MRINLGFSVTAERIKRLKKNRSSDSILSQRFAATCDYRLLPVLFARPAGSSPSKAKEVGITKA